MHAGVELIFLGWERPFLAAAAERWIEFVAKRGLDPARCVLVLPGRRAARRLEERIAQLAPPAWPPPRVVSEGDLARVLSKERVRLASEWQRALAWREVLGAASAQEREALWSGGERQGVAGLASLCARTFSELAREGLDAARVAEAAGANESFGAPQRWRTLAELERRYVAALERRGRRDPAAVARAAAQGELDTTWCVQLFALVDPPRALRKLLERVDDVASFVFAPAEHAADFDAFGALRSESWAEADVAFDDARWRVVDGPDDQAREALAELARVEPPPAPEEVAIGVPDEDVLPFLERRLLEAGCEPRWAGGQVLAHTREARLALDALAWLVRPGVEEFARLAAHPDFERLCGQPGGTLGAALDRYVGEHVPARIDGSWPADRAELRTSMRAAIEGLGAAVSRANELFGSTASGAHPSAEWADALARWLSAAFAETDLDARDPRGWKRARALELLAELVRELREADEGVAPVALDAAAFHELLAARLNAIDLPPPPGDGRPVVELFGWLELVLDDAPHLVITGVQEGSLPSAPGIGLLTEAARRELELGHEQRRVARDVWALRAILASRPNVTLLTGRRSSERNPHRPSRLLLRCAPERVVQRVRAVWPEHESDPPAAAGAPPSYRPPRPERAFEGVLRVTDFKTYIESPYAFYVQRVLGLRAVESRVLELDPRSFGSLAHEVLELVGHETWRACTDDKRLLAALEGRLEQLSGARFGSTPRPAVVLQIEKLRARLASFARWQAQQVELGWRTHAVEWNAPGIEIDGQRVAGRIDRIERHAANGNWRVVDYKTGDKSRPPRSAHFSRARGWIDLQLPLYRELTAELWRGAPLELGYVNLGRDEDDELFAAFVCSAEEHAEALEKAREVVRGIRAAEFERVGEKAPFDASLAALCGFGLLADEESDESEAEA
jgi:ATP-dependent helicase/nuclease subunit B